MKVGLKSDKIKCLFDIRLTLNYFSLLSFIIIALVLIVAVFFFYDFTTTVGIAIYQAIPTASTHRHQLLCPPYVVVLVDNGEKINVFLFVLMDFIVL